MELRFIDIDGFYGGDQRWLPTIRMRMGGCSTVTAAEICAYLAATRHGMKSLYPGDPSAIKKSEFIDFTAMLFSYVYPRVRGLTKLSLYAEGVKRYANSVGIDLSCECFPGCEPYESAAEFLINAIDSCCCVTCLLLDHEDKSLDDIIWHWFTLTGYEYQGGELCAVFATYGQRRTLPFRKIWESGREPRGGLIKFF